MSRTEPLNDFDERAVSAAEADLERLLSVEPSLEFAAKVRARIAEDGAKRSSVRGWIGLLATAAAAVIVVIVLRSGPHTNDQRSPFTPSAHADIVLNAERNSLPRAIVPVRPVIQENTHVVRRMPAPALTHEAEIIIDPAVSEAIRRLAVAARNTTLDGSRGESMAAPNSETETLPIAKPLDVPELALGPADQNGGQ